MNITQTYENKTQIIYMLCTPRENQQAALQQARSTYTNKNSLRFKLFNSIFKCPVCYEIEATSGMFKCRHCICDSCHSRLTKKICPLCRSS